MVGDDEARGDLDNIGAGAACQLSLDSDGISESPSVFDHTGLGRGHPKQPVAPEGLTIHHQKAILKRTPSSTVHGRSTASTDITAYLFV